MRMRDWSSDVCSSDLQVGAHVTLVNRTDVILRGYDEQIRDRLLQISMTKGIEFKFHVAFEKVDKQPDGSLLVHMTGHEPIPADMLLFATGRRPHTENLGLETADVALDAKGAIKDRKSKRLNSSQ